MWRLPDVIPAHLLLRWGRAVSILLKRLLERGDPRYWCKCCCTHYIPMENPSRKVGRTTEHQHLAWDWVPTASCQSGGRAALKSRSALSNLPTCCLFYSHRIEIRRPRWT